MSFIPRVLFFYRCNLEILWSNTVNLLLADNAPVSRICVICCGLFTVLFGIQGRSKKLDLSYMVILDNKTFYLFILSNLWFLKCNYFLDHWTKINMISVPVLGSWGLIYLLSLCACFHFGQCRFHIFKIFFLGILVDNEERLFDVLVFELGYFTSG